VPSTARISTWGALGLAVACLVLAATSGLAWGQGTVRGQVILHPPGGLTQPGQSSSAQRLISLAPVGFGVGSVSMPRPVGPLAVSISTTNRTLLPSLIRSPSAVAPAGSISATSAVGGQPLGTVAGTRRAVVPVSSTSSPVGRRPAAAAVPASPLMMRLSAPAGPGSAATTAARTYLETITQESQSWLVDSGRPVTSLAPAEPGPLRDLMLKGEKAFRRAEYADALQSFQLANDVSLNSPEAMIGMFHARFALSEDSYSSASFLLMRALRNLPELPLVPLDPKEFYGVGRDYGEQLAGLVEYCRRQPDEAEPLLVLTYFQWFAGDVSAAVDSLRQANAAAMDRQDSLVLEAIDTFWDGMVASGLVEGMTIAPPAETDDEVQPTESSDSKVADEPEQTPAGEALRQTIDENPTAQQDPASP